MRYSLAPVAGQIDDAAVDALAVAMKAKLAKKRAQGFGGWQTANHFILSDFLVEHVEKGDPVDVANFCAMLHYKGDKIEPY